MAVLQSTLRKVQPKRIPNDGALAAAALLILNSKFSNNEEVVLDQIFLNQESEDLNKYLVSVIKDSEIHTIINKVENAAYACHGSKFWQLSLQLPVNSPSGLSSSSIKLLIVETKRYIKNWQELVTEVDSCPHLVLVASPRDIGVELGFYPSGSSISATRTQRLFRQFIHVVNQLKDASPTAVVGDLDLVCSWDMKDIERWNQNPPAPVRDCVHLEVERQARQSPESAAVCAWDGNLSYRELSAISNRLARRLITLGVGPEVIVPLCFEKSVWAIVAMLAVLKSGGACVPLNPEHPRNRHLAILEDVQAPLVVCSETYQDLCRELNKDVIIVSPTTIDALPSDDTDGDSPNTGVGPENVAFAVFTSGSTGQPKGIIIEHQAMCTSVRDHGEAMRFGKHTRTIQFAAYTFDDSFSDIFTTLMYGGCICVPSEHDRLNDLAGSIVRMKANHACLTTTVASQLRPSDVPDLQTLVVGGESVTSRVLQQWGDHVYLINSYGPAEASIFCSANSGLSRIDDPINIGVGVGCLLHITDPLDHNKLLPIGAIGELLIEGPILARHYIGNETKTKASFITDPAWVSETNGSGIPRRRFYKTGDLARYNEDGTMQVLGRKDTQVKLYGQRIELGEIEHHLRSEIKGCKEVAVEVIKPKVESGEGAPIIVAFLLIQADNDSDGSETPELSPLQVMHRLPNDAGERLQQALPSYMIPSAFIRMQKMPLMVSGKLDRKKLREMASSLTAKELRAQEGENEAAYFSNPETPKEKALQSLWAEVLGAEKSSIKLESNFFRLGGDSVAAMKLVTAARDAGIKITVQKIFQNPSLGEQSAVVGFIEGIASGSYSLERFDLLEDGESSIETAIKMIGNHDMEVDEGQALILDMYPCSPLQSGVMALSARNPGSYIAQMAYELPEELDITRFKFAWEHVVQLNAILRTRIIQGNGASKLWQVVVHEQISWLQGEGLESYLASDREIPMKLGSKLARFAIVSSGPRRWFVWTLHHAIFDDESLRLLLRSVEKAYQDLPTEPGLEFNLFIKYVSQSDTQASEEFWKKQLESPPPPSFPLLPESDYLPLADQSVIRTVEYELRRGSEVTLSTILRATWAILLSQYSESKDVTFGCTVNGRSVPLERVETATGPTFATVPLRVTVDPECLTREFLRLLQQQYVDMIPHEQAGLQRIARWIPEARNICNFQSLLVVQAAESPGNPGSSNLLGMSEILGISAGFLTNALTIECQPTSGGIDLKFHFDSRIIPKLQVERLSRQFEHILRQLNMGSSETTIKSLDIITTDDIEELREWNSGYTETVNELMHQGFYSHVLTNPSSTAVEDCNNSLTYMELEILSSRLASFIVSEFGAQVGKFIPLCIEKSVLTVVSVLGILKAGGALLLLDPSLPVERLNYMISKTEAPFVMYSPMASELSSRISKKAVILDKNLLDNLPASDHFQVDIDPRAPACIIFTSGSTGNPKGTVISHRAWASGARKHSQFCEMTKVEPLRVLQFASVSFDMAMQEIVTTLSMGGCVCVPSESERTSEGIIKAINRMKVTWLFLTPTFASLIDPSSVPTLRTLVFGGEAAVPALFTHFPPHVRLLQVYGPSECTPITFVNSRLDEKVPGNIGRAFLGSSFLVDPLNHHKLVPIGGIGELLLGGPNIGDGYLGESAKTAQVFIQPPEWMKHFESAQTERMYLTGDLARYNADGNMIFVGRKDTQTKLRGQRMELTEIEHHLHLLIPQVRAIVAEVITPADQDRKILVAFLCLTQDTETEGDILLPPTTLNEIEDMHLPTITAQAASFLPRYMVPNIFLPIRKVPFMRSSTKVDRRSLRAIASKLDSSQLSLYTIRHQDKEIPRTPTEAKMRTLFANALALEEQSVGINDNFLLLGGDSIDAMRLVALAKTEGLFLTVGQIFKNPILSDLARTAAHDRDDIYNSIGNWELLKDLSTGDTIRAEAVTQCQLFSEAEVEDAYKCTPLQEGIFALSIAQQGTYSAQHVFIASPPVDVDALKIAWQRLFVTLNIFRTRIIQLPSSEMIQVIIRESLEWTTEDNLDNYLQRDRRVEFGLGGRLNRFALIQPPDSVSTFIVWTAHHSVYDGFSISLITTALESSLQDLWDGEAVKRQADFRQYIKYVGDSDSESCQKYWKGQFNSGEFIEFPSVNNQDSGHIEREPISEIIEYSQTMSATVTTSSIIRAAWAITIASYTGSSDVIFGATVSGRDAAVPNISEIIGPVISTVPVRVKIDYSKRVREFVEDIQEQAVQMIDFQHFGLQNIRQCGQEADAATRFQNLLVIQPSSFGKEGSIIQHQFGDGNDVHTHTYPMVIECDINNKSVEINALFDPSIVERNQMQRVLKLFGEFISQISKAAPELTLSQLRRVHKTDVETLYAWNSNVPAIVNKCVHHVLPFSTHAKQLAVRSWDGDLTYEELDVLSTRIARHLVMLGVGPEKLVPLCFRKSLWAIVSVISVLKAGGAPVFLNEEFPPQRISSLVEFLDAEILLTSVSMFPHAKPDVKVILEVGQKFADGIISDSPLPEVHPHNAAWASFTSGTTGVPKCIILEHRNICTMIHLYTKAGEFRPHARVLQFSSHTFDPTMKDYFATLLYGGVLYIPSDEDRMNNLLEYMQKEKITQATLTPTIGSLFGPNDVPSLEVLTLAGEKLTNENVATWAGSVHLNNAYGPSETTGRATCNPGLKVDSDPANIGFSFAAVCWVVEPEDHNLLVPIGAVGEIIVEGPTVTRGYFKNPEKTASAFIAPPEWVPEHRRTSHSRLYKTGDLGRLNPDGSLMILGRKDAQVKLRGQRIELEEVESQFKLHLPQHVGIVVEMVSPKDDKTNTQLCAFLYDKNVEQGSDDVHFMEPRLTVLEDLDINTVCGAAGQTLPPYMIPRTFLVINRVPLLPSAKTDRKILRALFSNSDPDVLAASSISSVRNIRVPVTQRQEQLRNLLAAVLRIDENSIGLDHSFLQLGGDSIKAIRLVSAARAEKIGLTVAGILQSPHLEGLDSIATNLEDQQEKSIQPFELLEYGNERNLVAEVAALCKVSDDLIEDIYPCTPLQEALMALSIQQSGDYIAFHTFNLPENIDLSRLQMAWNTVFQMNPILRTRIVHTQSEGLHQVVIKGDIEWSQGRHLATFLDSETKSPMGLGNALNRFGIVHEQSSRSPILVWVSHHATYDGVSKPLVIEIVEKIYQEIPLNRIPTADYRAFIKYIRDFPIEDSKKFWISQLADANPETFPSIPSGVEKVNATARLTHTVKIPQISSLTSAIIRAAWAMILAAYTSSNDIIFGTILSGRNAPVKDIDRMTGPTITTVPVRVRIDPNEGLGDFLSRLQNQAIEMIPHEHFGLQNIRRINDDLRDACDFQNLLVVHPTKEDTQDYPSILNTDISASLDMNTYPIVLEIQMHPDGYSVDISYDPFITSENQMIRIIHQFDNVISQISQYEATRPSKVEDVQVISPSDLEQIWQWNATVPDTVEESLHSLIDRRVKLSPDDEAIVSWEGRLTYGEFDRATSRLAQQILRRKTGVSSFIPLCFEKSLWTIVAMVAVLKAGKAFVLLDPSYPIERLRQITSVLNPNLAISSKLQENLCRELIPDTIVLEPKLIDELEDSFELEKVIVCPSDPVCAIFTSGTTGTPKGAILSHGSYCSSALQYTKAISMDASSRVLQFSSYSFDAILLEALTTLMVGGCVCVVEDKYRNIDIDIEINRMQVNYAFLTPSFASFLSPDRVPTLKTLVLVGEAANVPLIKTWNKKVFLHNGYGPSECSVFSTMNTNLDDSTSPMNLGRAVGGVCWIVDPNNVDRLVPIGAPGELLLEGPHIGEGYINDPTRTKATFLEHAPKWHLRRDKDYKGKFYRTGDRVKNSPDGSIIFLGRKDSQVKIRGQRVEMGDIENHLSTVSNLGHAIVMIPKIGRLRKRLVAVISVHKKTAFQGTHNSAELKIVPEDLRETAQSLMDAAQRKLSSELPSHMVPNFWVPVESIPVLPSGKLNRKRVTTWLEELDEQSWQRLIALTEISDEDSLTDMEKSLRLLWSKVLNVEISAINSRSAFLQLGGDSISAMQLMSSARGEGIRLTMLDITKSKNLRELAQLATPDISSLEKVNGFEVETVDTLFELSPIQKHYFNISPRGNDAFEQSMLLKMTQKVPVLTLVDALEKIVKHHSALRARYKKTAPGSWMQSISAQKSGEDILRIHNAQVSDIPYIISKSKQRLNFRDGPIFVADLVENGEEQYLFLAAHHLSVDLVSWRILLQDLEDLILHRVETLPRSLSFQSWCSLQSQYCQQLNPTKFLQHVEPFDSSYWGIHDGVSNTYADIVHQGFKLDKAASSFSLRECNTAFSSKPVDIFLASAITSFGRVFFDRGLPTVFLEGHGREPWNSSIDILRTVGWFTTLYPVSLEKREAVDIVSAVRSVKDHRNKFSDNGFSSFACSHYLQLPYSTSKSAVPEITLNYLGQYQQLEKKDALFNETDIDLSAQDASSQERFSLFNISVQVRDGEIHFDFSYNRASKHQDLISLWITECEVCMREAAVILPRLDRRYTPSDFPLLQTSNEELQTLLDDTLPSLGIEIGAVEDIFPCSPTQLDMLHDEENAIGHHMTRLNFEVINTDPNGLISLDLLSASFREVVKRHSILRTVFLPKTGPVWGFDQLILKEFSPEILLLNSADGIREPERTNRVYKKLHGGQPPYQITFCPGLPQKSIFISIDISHSIIDGASMAIILRDWDLAYQNKLVGIAPSYQNQIRLIQDRSSHEAISYWTQHLSGLTPFLLPLNGGGIKNERQQRLLPLKLPAMDILQKVCQQTSVTLPNLFHATWTLALHIATGSRNISFGYLVSGRDVALDGIEHAVGPYFNLLISRYKIDPSQTLHSILQTVQDTMTERLPFQNFSWPEMQQYVPSSKGPAFNTMINIHRFAPLDQEEDRKLKFSARKGFDPLAYDVELTGKIDSDISLYLAYWSTSVTDEWADGMASLIRRILDTMIRGLESPVEALRWEE